MWDKWWIESLVLLMWKVKLDNHDANYKANMIAKLNINDDIKNQALVVPSNIIHKRRRWG